MKFFTSLQAKQKLTKELEKFGHIKCKFESCGLLSKSVAEILKHMLHHNSSQKDDIVSWFILLKTVNIITEF